MVTDLYQYVSNQNFNNRQEVYGYLASQIDSQTLSQQEIESKFLEREAMGNIEIAQGVVLPHFTNENVQDKIFIVRLSEPILNWSKGIAKVNIVIALVINSQTAFKIRPQIQNLIQHLIDEQFIELLMTGSQLEIRNYLKQ